MKIFLICLLAILNLPFAAAQSLEDPWELGIRVGEGTALELDESTNYQALDLSYHLNPKFALFTSAERHTATVFAHFFLNGVFSSTMESEIVLMAYWIGATWYPWGNPWFLRSAVGITSMSIENGGGIFEAGSGSAGFLLATGWAFDLGKPGGWKIPLGIAYANLKGDVNIDLPGGPSVEIDPSYLAVEASLVYSF